MNQIYAGLGQLLQSAMKRPKIKAVTQSIGSEMEEIIDTLIECYNRKIGMKNKKISKT